MFIDALGKKAWSRGGRGDLKCLYTARSTQWFSNFALRAGECNAWSMGTMALRFDEMTSMQTCNHDVTEWQNDSYNYNSVILFVRYVDVGITPRFTNYLFRKVLCIGSSYTAYAAS